MFFRGTFEHTIDEKGRVSIPARFREILQASNDDRVVIANFVIGTSRCLDVYPYQAWVQLEEQVVAKEQFNQRLLQFQNYYLARAHDCVVDRHGRILLPPILRDYAGLNREVVFTSALRKFRIWDPEQWKQVFAAAEKAIMEQPGDLNDLQI